MLSAQGLTLAVAESCTGGIIGAAITSVPGSSGYFQGGVIAYSNHVKRRVLGVDAGVLAKKGAVSAETAKAMARGVQRLLCADCAISVTGVAGPGGGTKEKPVGLVYVGIAKGKTAGSVGYRLNGNRREVRLQAAAKAVERMIDALSSTSATL